MTPAQAHSKGDQPPQEVSWGGGGGGGQEEGAGAGALGAEMIEAGKERCHPPLLQGGEEGARPGTGLSPLGPSPRTWVLCNETEASRLPSSSPWKQQQLLLLFIS